MSMGKEGRDGIMDDGLAAGGGGAFGWDVNGIFGDSGTNKRVIVLLIDSTLVLDLFPFACIYHYIPSPIHSPFHSFIILFIPQHPIPSKDFSFLSDPPLFK